MSETKRNFIHCDVPHCTDYVMGEPSEVASRLRRRIAKHGWVSRWRELPPTEFMVTHGISPRKERDDFCPFHAFKIKED